MLKILFLKYTYHQEKNIVDINEIISNPLSEEVKVKFFSENKVSLLQSVLDSP